MGSLGGPHIRKLTLGYFLSLTHVRQEEKGFPLRLWGTRKLFVLKGRNHFCPQNSPTGLHSVYPKYRKRGHGYCPTPSRATVAECRITEVPRCRTPEKCPRVSTSTPSYNHLLRVGDIGVEPQPLEWNHLPLSVGHTVFLALL